MKLQLKNIFLNLSFTSWSLVRWSCTDPCLATPEYFMEVWLSLQPPFNINHCRKQVLRLFYIIIWGICKFSLWVKKPRIQETLNLLTFMDSSTDTMKFPIVVTFGPSCTFWHFLAIVWYFFENLWTFWHFLALFGMFWHIFSCFSKFWHFLALFGPFLALSLYTFLTPALSV